MLQKRGKTMSSKDDNNVVKIAKRILDKLDFLIHKKESQLSHLDEECEVKDGASNENSVRAAPEHQQKLRERLRDTQRAV